MLERWCVVDDHVTHVFVTNEREHGYSMDSPQVPGLVFGRNTETEFRAEYQQVLHDVGVRGRVTGHTQLRIQAFDGSECLIRFMQGETEAERKAVAVHVERLVKSAERCSEFLGDLMPSPTGEYVFVACLATDTLGWLIDQLNPRGDVLTAVVGVADVMLAATQLASGITVDWPPIYELGWTREMTLQDLLQRRPSERPLLAQV